MITLITIRKDACTKIEHFKSKEDTIAHLGDVLHNIKSDDKTTILETPDGTLYIIIDSGALELNTLVPRGKLNTNVNCNENYPGLDIEYIPDNDDEYPDVLTRPRVLIEKPIDTKILATMIWADKGNEDYSHKIKFE